MTSDFNDTVTSTNTSIKDEETIKYDEVDRDGEWTLGRMSKDEIIDEIYFKAWLLHGVVNF